MKNIIITGANGFIGSHLAEGLSKNHHVIAIVNKKTDFLNGLNVEVIEWDITSKKVIKGLPEIDIVYHLASLTDMKKFHGNVSYGKKVNVDGTENVIKCIGNTAKKFVYLSTLGVYGNAKHFPVSELEHPAPLEPYAMSKLEAENLTAALCQQYGLNFVIARLFNCYGERQKHNSLIPSLIIQTLNSNEVHIGNMKPTRDFIYVRDAVSALELLGKQKCTGIYNVGTGIETSIAELMSKIIKTSGKKIKIIQDSSKFKEESIEVLRSCADISKIRVLGWSPKSLLMEGIAKTYSYYENLLWK